MLSSPSGAGKTTLSRKLLEHDSAQNDDPKISLSISYTTRPRREAEVDGKDYFFVDDAKFEETVAEGGMLEHAKVFGAHYGTPKDLVVKNLEAGVDVLFDVDWQGTRQLKEKMREDLVSVFILPPSLDELENRLKGRAQDSHEVIKKRMAKAASEISHWEEYDYVVVNEDVDAALAEILMILNAERLKRTRQKNLPEFTRELCEGA